MSAPIIPPLRFPTGSSRYSRPEPVPSDVTGTCFLVAVWGVLVLISWRSFYPATDALFFALVAFAALAQPRTIPSLLLITFFAPICLEVDRPYVIAFALLISIGLIRYSPSSRFANANTSLLSALLLWLLYLIPASLNSPTPDAALQIAFVQNIEGIVFVAVLLAFLDSERSVASLAKTVAVLGAGAFLIGLVHFLWRDHMWATTQFLRQAQAAGSEGIQKFSVMYGQIVLGGRIMPSGQEPNYWAAQLQFPLWMAVALAARPQGRRERWGWIICSVACLAGVLGTYSRGAILTLLALLGIYAVRGRVKGLIPITALVVAACGMFMTAPLLVDRILGIQDDIARHGGSGRLALWSQALDLWLDSPVVGIGLMGFQARTGLAVHNSYLSVLVDTGVIGLSLYVGILCLGLSWWNSAFKIAHAREDHLTAAIASGGLYGMIGVLVNLFFITATDPRLPWLPTALGYAFYRALAVAPYFSGAVAPSPQIQSSRHIR